MLFRLKLPYYLGRAPLKRLFKDWRKGNKEPFIVTTVSFENAKISIASSNYKEKSVFDYKTYIVLNAEVSGHISACFLNLEGDYIAISVQLASFLSKKGV